MKTKSTLMLTVTLLLFVFATTQTSAQKEIAPYYGKAGITKKISELPPTTVKKTLDSTAIRPLRSYFKKYDNFRVPKGMATGIPLPRGGGDAEEDQSTPSTSSSLVPDAGSKQIRSNFLAIDFYEFPVGWPPDPSGAVSESQVIVSTNNGIAVFEKPGVTEPPV